MPVRAHCPACSVASLGHYSLVGQEEEKILGQLLEQSSALYCASLDKPLQPCSVGKVDGDLAWKADRGRVVVTSVFLREAAPHNHTWKLHGHPDPAVPTPASLSESRVPARVSLAAFVLRVNVWIPSKNQPFRPWRACTSGHSLELLRAWWPGIRRLNGSILACLHMGHRLQIPSNKMPPSWGPSSAHVNCKAAGFNWQMTGMPRSICQEYCAFLDARLSIGWIKAQNSMLRENFRLRVMHSRKVSGVLRF